MRFVSEYVTQSDRYIVCRYRIIFRQRSAGDAGAAAKADSPAESDRWPYPVGYHCSGLGNIVKKGRRGTHSMSLQPVRIATPMSLTTNVHLSLRSIRK